MLRYKFSINRADSTIGQRSAEFDKLVFTDIALERDGTSSERIGGSSQESSDLCSVARIERRLAANEEDIFVPATCFFQPDSDIARRHGGLMRLSQDCRSLVVKTFQSRPIEYT